MRSDIDGVPTLRVGRRPGRPESVAQAKEETRETILDAAEQLFAKFGHAATSFRDIALAASVNPALISYYFGSKRVLYEEVYKRRGKDLTDRWTELLDQLEACGKPCLSVEQILRVYFSAQFEIKKKGAGGLAFFRLQTRLHSEPEEQAFLLRREVYDVVGKRFIALLEQAAPEIDKADISWRFVFLVGVGLYMTSDVDRLDDLSSDRFDSQNLDEALERTMQFCVAGMNAPSAVFAGRRPTPGPKLAKGRSKAEPITELKTKPKPKPRRKASGND